MPDYQASERADYIEAFFRNVDWNVVENRADWNASAPLRSRRVT